MGKPYIQKFKPAKQRNNSKNCFVAKQALMQRKKNEFLNLKKVFHNKNLLKNVYLIDNKKYLK